MNLTINNTVNLGKTIIVTQTEYNTMFMQNIMYACLVVLYLIVGVYLYNDKNKKYKFITDNNEIVMNCIFPFLLLLLSAIITMMSVLILNNYLVMIPFLVTQIICTIKLGLILKYLKIEKLGLTL